MSGEVSQCFWLQCDCPCIFCLVHRKQRASLPPVWKVVLSFVHLREPPLGCHSDSDFFFQMSYFTGFEIMLLSIRNIARAHLAWQKAEHRMSHLPEPSYLEENACRGGKHLSSQHLTRVPGRPLDWHKVKVRAIWLQRCRGFSTIH